MSKPLTEIFPIAEVADDLAKEGIGHVCSRGLFPFVNRALNDLGYMAAIFSLENDLLHFHIEKMPLQTESAGL